MGGWGSLVRVLPQNSNAITSFYAFDPNFTGGMSIAVANLNGSPDIIVGAGPGGGPQVEIFSATGQLLTQFWAFDPNVTGGVNIAVGDVTGDGTPDIIVAAGAGGGRSGGASIREAA